VLGGIGSGKTSELLRACAELRRTLHEIGDFVEYCDVSSVHDLKAAPAAGVLVALTGNLLMSAIDERGIAATNDPKLTSAMHSLRQFAQGHSVWINEYDDDDYPHDDDDQPPGFWSWQPGVLQVPPGKLRHSRLTAESGALQEVLRHYPGPQQSAVILFDSLDRLPQTQTFQQMVTDDIRALKSAGVGVVVVGPVRFIAGHDRSLVDLFDHVHFQLATDPGEPAGEAFLCEVLHRRTQSSGILPDECITRLAHLSGGVLRDLVSLAKRSAEEAYANGHPSITISDTERAGQVFGRSLAIGLDDEQVKILRMTDKKRAFVVRGERELSLLETRRVLLYPGNRWVVHPTLKPLLVDIPASSD
jgi:hypothetical protein